MSPALCLELFASAVDICGEQSSSYPGGMLISSSSLITSAIIMHGIFDQNLSTPLFDSARRYHYCHAAGPLALESGAITFSWARWTHDDGKVREHQVAWYVK